jgi:hypothetical protein
VHDDATSSFAAAIHDHLELKRRNAALEFDMPLTNYTPSRARVVDARTSQNRQEVDLTLEDEDTLPGVAWPR